MAAGKKTTATEKPGKSRQETRREEIIKAAAPVFFEHGFAGTSIDDIIAKVGGSKRTIYSEFGSKEGLFAAIVTDNARHALAALAPEAMAGRNLDATLLEFARELNRVQMSPTVLALYRLVVAEGVRFPELAKLFYDSGPGLASARLSQVLKEFLERGDIALDDPDGAADEFVGMIRDNRHLKTVLGLMSRPSAEDTEQRAQTAVRIFLDGVRPRR
ncbi:MAG: TetR/AcrR family transcriptional regulator [Alphaproteobacteria bacterium]|nr:TetR/AcrR family transcriptional regulator [Alphaproteobacteria bacterium]MDE1986437.1 TetR/AcrR family transcriptional regulator [Alphaproteobacteria bacterium]MDE2163851.1 TetR/AcrR family transcriptional regulator [Alphaproteobacteria bacterium]MDE2264609.1 TetR/AcrR family transcriptional regulator [Alphaproteobacteria bacterium]MDE2498870.1 TetR/AcrR family transcriptional regulator [Alphaproteobacteria bacterium]